MVSKKISFVLFTNIFSYREVTITLKPNFWLVKEKNKMDITNLRPLNSMVSPTFTSKLIHFHTENLTREQYAGAIRPRFSMFNSARDALNPHANAETLRNRLWVIDHYRFRYGAAHHYWVHTALSKLARNVRTYGLNYAVKALIGYQIYSSLQTYRHVNNNTLMTTPAKVNFATPIFFYTGVLGFVSMIV